MIPSKRMRSAAIAEMRRLEATRAKVDAKADKLIAALELVQAEQASLNDTYASLVRLAAGDLAAEATDGGDALKGAEVRIAAVRVLVDAYGAGHAVHYRDWFALLGSKGHTVRGKDPLATFLTQISRSPVVRRSTAAGVYEIDENAAPRLQRTLADRQVELRDLCAVIAGQGGIPTTVQATRRAALLTVTRRLEADLVEAEQAGVTLRGASMAAKGWDAVV